MANTLTRNTPRSDMVPTRSVIDQLLDGSWFAPATFDRWVNGTTATFPANLVETDDKYVVQVALPGLDSDQLEIQVSERDLRISGTYESFEVEKGNYLWRGLPTGQFTQSFTLPAEVMGDGAEANYTNGILRINLPKSEKAKVKTISVKKTV